jgi:non-homologous end joining protein Ku
MPRSPVVRYSSDLIENMSDEFEPDKYRDEYRERVQHMLDEKSKGQEITVLAPEAPRHGQIIDLMQALKQSIEKAKRSPNKRLHQLSASEKPLPKFVIIPLSPARLVRWTCQSVIGNQPRHVPKSS